MTDSHLQACMSPITPHGQHCTVSLTPTPRPACHRSLLMVSIVLCHWLPPPGLHVTDHSSWSALYCMTDSHLQACMSPITPHGQHCTVSRTPTSRPACHRSLFMISIVLFLSLTRESSALYSYILLTVRKQNCELWFVRLVNSDLFRRC